MKKLWQHYELMYNHGFSIVINVHSDEDFLIFFFLVLRHIKVLSWTDWEDVSVLF